MRTRELSLVLIGLLGSGACVCVCVFVFLGCGKDTRARTPLNVIHGLNFNTYLLVLGRLEIRIVHDCIFGQLLNFVPVQRRSL